MSEGNLLYWWIRKKKKRYMSPPSKSIAIPISHGIVKAEIPDKCMVHEVVMDLEMYMNTPAPTPSPGGLCPGFPAIPQKVAQRWRQRHQLPMQGYVPSR